MSELRAQYEAEVNELHFGNGAFVRNGDIVLTLSVCKMLSGIQASNDGLITYCCSTGDYVSEGQILARIE